MSYKQPAIQQAVKLLSRRRYWNNLTALPHIDQDDTTLSAYNITPLVRSGISCPDWKARIRAHQDATTPFSRVESSMIPLRIFQSARTWSNADPSRFISLIFEEDVTVVLGAMPMDSSAHDYALLTIKKRLRELDVSSSLAAPLAELTEFHKLVEYLARTADSGLTSLLSIRAQIRSGRYRHAYKQLVHDASEAWLAYSFAVKPLVNDVEQAAHSLAAQLGGQVDYPVNVSAVGHFRDSRCGSYNPSFGSGRPITINFTDFIDGKVKIKVGYVTKLQAANDYSSIPVHYGLSGENAILAAWELLPFSWVADYFGNMQEFLTDTIYGVEGRICFCVLMETVTRKSTHSMVQYSNNTYNEPNSSSVLDYCISPGEALVKSYNRSPLLLSADHIQLRFKTCGEMGSHGFNKLANLGSVLGANNGEGIRTTRRISI